MDMGKWKSQVGSESGSREWEVKVKVEVASGHGEGRVPYTNRTLPTKRKVEVKVAGGK